MYRSRSGSNQPEAHSIVFSTPTDEPEGVKKVKGKRSNIQKLQLDSPAIGTRRKRVEPTSPAMGTRSKRVKPTSPAMSIWSKILRS